MSALVLVERVGSTAVLRLNRAERHNSLVPELLEALLAALERVEAAPDVRAVVLSHAGRSFSTGGDVGVFAAFVPQSAELAQYAQRLLGLLNAAILRLAALRCPVIAAVEGWLTGGSLGLVLACDMTVLGEGTRIAPYYTVVGFSPDGGWTAMLPQLIGAARSRAIQLENTTLTASQAVALGLATHLAPAREAEAMALSLAAGLKDKVPGSVAHTRALLRWDADALAAGLERERVAFVAQVTSVEAAAGMRRFLGDGCTG
ncbi:enoyl-CoA hydratase/isomerase family protein [Cupriavidus basilensis]|uniref:enoyl-CoA hydratase/isomerase family protein n=1 Tax=Cupriavidus basilensis TaxID=68895 RepID=UPI00157AC56A|nr:enoyl-CoA hydratase/isomerase family protein [Cupriavidus basilensis]NUA30758.1 enoyl-CoA hydratase/isomerase family protein [Cupriavidus basilensis]